MSVDYTPQYTADTWLKSWCFSQGMPLGFCKIPRFNRHLKLAGGVLFTCGFPILGLRGSEKHWLLEGPGGR